MGRKQHEQQMKAERLPKESSCYVGPLGVLLALEERALRRRTTSRLVLLDRANLAGRQDLIAQASRKTFTRMTSRDAGPPPEVVDESWAELERLLAAAGVP